MVLQGPGPGGYLHHGRCAKQPDGADGLSVKYRQMPKSKTFPYHHNRMVRRPRQDHPRRSKQTTSKQLLSFSVFQIFSFSVLFFFFNVVFLIGSNRRLPRSGPQLTWCTHRIRINRDISSSEPDLEPKPRASAANSEPQPRKTRLCIFDFLGRTEGARLSRRDNKKRKLSNCKRYPEILNFA